MKVSRSCYYAWKSSNKLINVEELMLKSEIQTVFKKSRKTYGSRRLSKAMQGAGYKVGRYKARSLMKKLNLEVRYPKKLKITTDSNHEYKVATNVLNRGFMPLEPNKVWTTDISYVRTIEGWLYLSIVIDLFSRQVVGWAIDEHMRAELCIQALEKAYWNKKPKKGLLHHSDRGSQYASSEYTKKLEMMGMVQSMSKKGDCYDNSPTERFFRSLKSEYLNYEKVRNKVDTKLGIIDYIIFYNHERMHSTLSYQTPIEYEEAYYEKSA